MKLRGRNNSEAEMNLGFGYRMIREIQLSSLKRDCNYNQATLEHHKFTVIKARDIACAVQHLGVFAFFAFFALTFRRIVPLFLNSRRTKAAFDTEPKRSRFLFSSTGSRPYTTRTRPVISILREICHHLSLKPGTRN